jgi:hypothetical protein
LNCSFVLMAHSRPETIQSLNELAIIPTHGHMRLQRRGARAAGYRDRFVHRADPRGRCAGRLVG